MFQNFENSKKRLCKNARIVIGLQSTIFDSKKNVSYNSSEIIGNLLGKSR